MFREEDGRLSLSKVSYATTLGVCLLKVLLSGVSYGEFSIETVDYNGLVLILGVTAGTYFGRSNTKAKG